MNNFNFDVFNILELFSGAEQKALAKADLGQKMGGFVMINSGKSHEKIYLAEGIETALSVAEGCPNNTVLAVLAVQNFKQINPFKETKEIVICADYDGLKNHTDKPLIQAINRLQEKGCLVSICMPESSDVHKKMDFNDLLKEQGRQGLQKSISKPVEISDHFKSSDPKITLAEAIIKTPDILTQNQPQQTISETQKVR